MSLFSHTKENVGDIIGSNIREAFGTISIQFKESPDGSMQPGEWLARGVSKSQPEARLIPQSGKFASFGIFFSDNYGNLVVPENGIVYVCRSNKFSWIPDPSEDWKIQVEETAQDKHLDLTRISDGYEAERKLFENYCVYQTQSGIATINRPIDSSQLDFILRCTKGEVILLK